MNHEQTRTRQHGTQITNSAQSDDPGMARMAAIRRIVEQHQYEKIDGLMVDGFTASIILQVYDAINETNQVKLRNLPIRKIASVCLGLVTTSK